MSLSKINLIRILIFWLFLFLFFNNPFITDVLMPKVVRYIPPVLLLATYFVYISDSKERILKMFFLFAISIFYFFYWIVSGTFIASNALILIYSCLMLYMINSVNKDESTHEMLTSIWDKFVWISIISSVLSFILFNIFNKIGYRAMTLGNYSDFNTFFNPILGVVSIRNVVSLTIGRVSWFTSEPSYMGFIHGLNIFWFLSRKKELMKKKFQLGLGLSILSLLFTFSFGSWLSLAVALIIFILFNIILFFLNIVKLSYKKIVFFTGITVVLLVFCIIFFDYLKLAYLFYSEFASNLDKYSSLDDRSLRIENSMKMIREMNIGKYIFGYGPGSIEGMFDRGESNGWLKSFIETGLLTTSFYLITLFRFVLMNRNNLFLFMFVVTSFNSIIIMYSPFVIFYLILLYNQNRKYQITRIEHA